MCELIYLYSTYYAFNFTTPYNIFPTLICDIHCTAYCIIILCIVSKFMSSMINCFNVSLTLLHSQSISSDFHDPLNFTPCYLPADFHDLLTLTPLSVYILWLPRPADLYFIVSLYLMTSTSRWPLLCCQPLSYGFHVSLTFTLWLPCPTHL